VTAVAVVSGANRGIGLEVARVLAGRGMSVVAGARDPDAVPPIEGDVRPRALDVADPASVAVLGAWVADELGRVDVLVNNAGIYPGGRASTLDLEGVAERAWQVNALGAWRLANALVALMPRGARIVNVSSGAGSLSTMDGFMPAYNVSKAALNAITRVLADDLRGRGILVNSVCPGWVRTDMGGPSATRSLAEGAASVLWAVDLDADGPTGGFFRDGRPVAW
jgi:NAD(P)-dependent dehydrogenase (short-subunit alcohol dehydrogenase family)